MRALIAMPDMIATMEAAVTAFSAGQVVQPVRTIIECGQRKPLFGSMPAYVDSLPAVGAKLVTQFDDNAQLGLPANLSTVVMLDPQTGAVTGIMDGRYITETRTAAVSAVSVKKLAREDASVLAILGSGVQAHSHFESLSHVKKFREVRVWSRTRAHLDAFAKEIGAIPCDTAEAAARGADIIVIAASTHTPLLFNDWVSPGTHVISIGSARAHHQEMEPALIARARVFVDSRAAALAESGDLIPFGSSHIVGELGEPGSVRKSKDEITIFKSVGMAVEDVFSGHLVMTRAKAAGRGLQI